VQKCTTTVDHTFGEAHSCFWRAINKASKNYSYDIQIIHILVSWNPLKNGDHTFGEAHSCFWRAINKASKTYSYNIQIIHILVSWNPLKNGDKIYNFFFFSLMIVNSVWIKVTF
jgi:hypothetical protein